MEGKSPTQNLTCSFLLETDGMEISAHNPHVKGFCSYFAQPEKVCHKFCVAVIVMTFTINGKTEFKECYARRYPSYHLIRYFGNTGNPR